jgi:hypothetical protein
VYGNTLLIPLIGGSGGSSLAGSTAAGGGGGGAILIASSTQISISGTIYAFGGDGYGGGSGGAIRIIAPVVSGQGNTSVNFGYNFNVFGGNGSGTDGSAGRVRIDTLNRLAWRGLIFTGKWTSGTQMITGLENNPPRLDIIEVAGGAIPEGTTNAVHYSLPVGTPTNQPVVVKATGFTNDVPITIAVTPENGPSFRFNSVIPHSGGPSSTTTVNVVFPLDAYCHLRMWTR